MTSVDRILAIYDGLDSPERLVALGATLEEADAALSLARLDLEATLAANQPRAREIVDEFLRSFWYKP